MSAPLAGVVLIILVALYAFKSFIPKISRQSLTIFRRQNHREDSLRRQLKELKEEQDGIDVKEEFANHARLQRKINKITDELKSIRNSKLKTKLTVQWTVTIILHILHKICYGILIWRLREHPIVHMKEEWTWPFGPVLAFPCGQPGAIGITWWVIACSLVIEKAHQYLVTTKVKAP